MELDEEEIQETAERERRIAEQRQEVADLRHAAATNPDESQLRLARSLSRLAYHLVQAGRPEEALIAAEEAVVLERSLLIAGHTDAGYALPGSVRNLASAASSAHNPQRALAIIHQTIDALRPAAAESEAFEAIYARQLIYYSDTLGRMDRAAALATAEESAAIWRRRGDTFELDANLRNLQRWLEAVGRWDDARAVHRERFASLTADSLLEDADFTVDTYNALAGALSIKAPGCDRLRDVPRLSERDFLYEPTDNRRSVQEVNEKLALVGLGPLEPGSPAPEWYSFPEVPTDTFGALSVWCDAEDAVAQVRAAVAEAYAADGVRQVDADTHWRLYEEERLLDHDRKPEVNTAEKLGSDLVVILPEGRRVGVYSERWELTPQGRHPVARGLSSRWPVLSLTAIEGVAYELCLYRDGAPVQYAAHGRPAQPPPVAAPIDPAQLAAESVVDTSEAELRAVFGDQFAFGNLAGLPSTGIKYKLEGWPVYDPDEAGDSALFLWRYGEPDRVPGQGR